MTDLEALHQIKQNLPIIAITNKNLCSALLVAEDALQERAWRNDNGKEQAVPES